MLSMDYTYSGKKKSWTSTSGGRFSDNSALSFRIVSSFTSSLEAFSMIYAIRHREDEHAFITVETSSFTVENVLCISPIVLAESSRSVYFAPTSRLISCLFESIVALGMNSSWNGVLWLVYNLSDDGNGIILEEIVGRSELQFHLLCFHIGHGQSLVGWRDKEWKRSLRICLQSSSPNHGERHLWVWKNRKKYFSLFLRHGRSREQGDRTNNREEKGKCHSQRFAEEWTTLEGRECEKVFLLVCSRMLDFLLLPTRVLSSWRRLGRENKRRERLEREWRLLKSRSSRRERRQSEYGSPIELP